VCCVYRFSAVCAKGKTHDITILKGSRPPIRGEAEKIADRGYQGIKRLYPNAVTPFKKSKFLNQQQCKFNCELSKRRIVIEHVNRRCVFIVARTYLTRIR
jgi:hypothetical protein